ncbi:MAG: nucleoside deaminase [Desulfovibrio sp.]|nr:MAG: nucleoside deaminase [Desulfovibrio sp.]
MNGPYDSYMHMALEQARQSLKQGNHGFGAVIVRDGEVVAKAHDTEETTQDCTAHAEMNAIRLASKKLGKDLSGCVLVSTHEPCPMCATAIVWSKLSGVVFGYAIADAIKEGRKRIALYCDEMFARANTDISLQHGILKEECALLYNRWVRKEVAKLRDASDEDFSKYNEELAVRRLQWFREHKDKYLDVCDSLLMAAYEFLIDKLGAKKEEMPIVEKSENKIVFHSMNFCPTLEACKILDLDTRHVCKSCNEEATDRLVKQVHPSLRFSRNYSKLRPFSPYCEESITIVADEMDLEEQ